MRKSLGTLIICYYTNSLHGHSSRIDIMRDNPNDDQSYTNNILIHYWRLMTCIAIDNGSDNTVGGSYYSAHQAVGKFEEHHIDTVSCIHLKCQTRAGVSGDVNIRRLNVSL